MMHKIQTAIIGYGMSGRYFHLPPLLHHPNYHVKYIMTRNENTQKELSEKYPYIDVITDYHIALEDEAIELIIIATSNDVHYSYTKEAILHKKHVVCEKPFVDTYTKAKELFDLARKNQVILRVFHNRQYDGDILTIKKILASYDFGQIVSFTARFDTFDPVINDNWRWQEGHMAGVYYDLAPHLVHDVINLFGMPNLVSNTLFDDRPGTRVDDHFEMALYYDDLTCFIGAHKLNRDPRPRFEIIGSKASYVKYGFDQPDLVHYATDDIYQTSNLRSELIYNREHKQTIPLLKGEHYRFYDLLADHIDEYPEDDKDEHLALQVILIMQLGLVSHQTKQLMKVPHKDL